MHAEETPDYCKTGEAECDGDIAESEPHDDALIEADQNVYEERFRVDRRKLEQMLRGDDGCEVNAAEEFFRKVMQQTGTQITWPSKLKIGAKSKKDPHIKVTGDPLNVKAAKDYIMTVLDTKSNRVTLKMDVSYTEHSHVIGKGGANIKKVMQATGCHIHFPDSNRSSQMVEKSNQVSIAGSPLGVENARLQIRDLLPLVIVFELPVAGVLQPDADDTTSVVQRVQQMYGVSITFKQRPPCLATVVVRGTVGHSKAVKEATLRLIEHLSASAMPAVPVSLQMDISQQHQMLLFNRNSSSLKQITQQMGTTVHFPDLAAASLAGQLLLPCRPGMAYITGPLDAVHQTRQLIIGCLPLVLMFDMKEDIIVDQSLISHLAEELDVFISIKPKPKQPSRSVIVKSVERNSANIFEARRRLLGLTVEDDEANDTAFVDPAPGMPRRQGARSPESSSTSGGSVRNSSDVSSTAASETSRNRDGRLLMPASPSPRSGSPLTSALPPPVVTSQAGSSSSSSSAVAAAVTTAMVTGAAARATLAAAGMATAGGQTQQTGPQRQDGGGSGGGGVYGGRTPHSGEPRLSGSWNLPSGGLRLESGGLPGRRLGMPPSSRPGLSGLCTANPADCMPHNGPKTSSSEIDLPAALQEAVLPFHDLKRLLMSGDAAVPTSPRRLLASSMRATSPTVLDGNVPYRNGSIYRSSEELAAEGGCTDKRAPGAERAAAMRKPLPAPPPGLTGPPNPTSVSDALADYERKKLLASKAIQQEPIGETRSPTDFWSGLGFSKSMPDSVIRDRLRQSGAQRYVAPSMETTFEAAGDSESERENVWNESSIATRVTQLPEDFLLKRFDYGLSSSNHLDASSPPLQHTSWSAAGLQQRKVAMPSSGAVAGSEGGLSSAGAAAAAGGSVPPADLATLLSSMGLGKYIDLFHQQEIDLATFLTLSDGDLKELGITTFGARRKMLLAIADLKKRPTFSPTPGSNNPFRASSTTMARRHDIVSQSGRW